MAIPRVFVSSTCYDLKYIRENLKFFIRTIGYEPILSEDGDVFYNPRKHTHDSCISEVSTCHMFVLIIGGRYGGQYVKGDKSITNMEYEEAVRIGIPIFALVESSVYSNHLIYLENIKNNKKVNAKNINYPAVDNIKIFDFIDNVRKNVINNALYPFGDFSDIETYLKKQWAGMMHYFITTEAEAKRVNQLFESIQEATHKVEFFTRQMVKVVGNSNTKLTVQLYDMMYGYETIRILSIWGIKLTPLLIIKNETVDSLCDNEIFIEEDEDDGGYSITHGGPPYKISEYAYDKLLEDYSKLRSDLLKKLEEESVTPEEYIALCDNSEQE